MKHCADPEMGIVLMKEFTPEEKNALARAIVQYQLGLHLQPNGTIMRNPEFLFSSVKRRKV